MGGRLSDHGLNYLSADFPSDATAEAIFDSARDGSAAGAGEHGQFLAYMMIYFGKLDAARGWTKQMHFGALRNNSTRDFEWPGRTPVSIRSAIGPKPRV